MRFVHCIAVLFCATLAQASVISSGTATFSLQGLGLEEYSFVADGLTLADGTSPDGDVGFQTCNGNAQTCDSSGIANPSIIGFPVNPYYFGPYLIYAYFNFSANPVALSPAFGDTTYKFPFLMNGTLTVFPFFNSLDPQSVIASPPCIICMENVSGFGQGTITITHVPANSSSPTYGEFYLSDSETLVFAPEPATVILVGIALALSARLATKDRNRSSALECSK